EAELTSSGATIVFNPSSLNTFKIQSNEVGLGSTILITPSAILDIFKSITGFITFGPSVAGTNPTHGYQNVTLPSSPTPNTATGLPYTATTSNTGYTVGISTIGL